MRTKRWDYMKERTQECDTFLDELLALCEKHDVSLDHEDGHGAFRVVARSDEVDRHLWEAKDDVSS